MTNEELNPIPINEPSKENQNNIQSKDKSLTFLKVLLVIQILIFLFMLIITFMDKPHPRQSRCPNAWGCVCKDDESFCECNYCADENYDYNEECKIIKKVSCPNPNMR